MKVKNNEERITPTLLAMEFNGQFVAWCPYCVKFHYHGIGEGHRSAHCKADSNSPFRKGGYFLKKGSIN